MEEEDYSSEFIPNAKSQAGYKKYYKFTSSSVAIFVNLVWERVKDAPEKLEKPTCIKFYQKIIDDIPPFEDAGHRCLKNKMNKIPRHL